MPSQKIASEPAAAASSPSAPGAISRRKDEHLDVVRQKDVGFDGLALGFSRFTLEFDALPELDLDEVSLETTLLGRSLAAPLFIGAMTGGSERAGRVNERLSRVAERAGVGLALGSQRAMISDPALAPSFDVRAHAPGLRLVLGNVGAVQLNYGVTTSEVQGALDRVGADALNLHLNPLQEAVQPEGDTRFSGLREKIAALAASLGVPVIVKECGAGLSRRTLLKLRETPIAGVEVAGVGGTSWAKVESHRADASSPSRQIGQRLAGFGVPTPDATALARDTFPDRLVIASGGIRTAMDAAVAIALGADAVAIAAPLFRAADESEAEAERVLTSLLHELRVVLFTSGLASIAALKEAPLIAPGDDALSHQHLAHLEGRLRRGW